MYMADHVRVEASKGRAIVELPAGFCGQILLHCAEGRVMKYETSEVRRPTSPDGTQELREVARG